MDDYVKQRVQELHAGSMTKEGHLVVVSQRHRTQEANLKDAIDKLEAMLVEAATIPKLRELKTDPTEQAKRTWIDEKRRRSEVKARRRGGRWGDD